jgi:hypothetical protein
MNTIIAIRGVGNTGKTETIKTFYRLLKSKYPTSKIENEVDRLDIRVIITINGVKIGIESQGDPSSRLFESIPLFVRNQCSIIVCATRSKGKTVQLIKEQENYEIIWHKRSLIEDVAKQQESNTKMVNTIMEKIVDVINNA